MLRVLHSQAQQASKSCSGKAHQGLAPRIWASSAPLLLQLMLLLPIKLQGPCPVPSHWQMVLVAKCLPYQHTPKTCAGWRGKHNKAAPSKGPPCLICLPYPLCGLCFQACFGTRENISCNWEEKKRKKKSISLSSKCK